MIINVILGVKAGKDSLLLIYLRHKLTVMQ